MPLMACEEAEWIVDKRADGERKRVGGRAGGRAGKRTENPKRTSKQALDPYEDTMRDWHDDLLKSEDPSHGDASR